MKKDAHEFAHLIKAFKGAAQYMWETFDHVMLSAIYSECIAIDEEINRDVNAQQNKASVNVGSDFSFSNLEDSPINEEQQKAFEELLRQAELKTNKKAKISKAVPDSV